MIAAWMLWSTGVGLLLLIAALAAEGLVDGRRRWVWAAACLGTVVLTAARVFAGGGAGTAEIPRETVVAQAPTPAGTNAAIGSDAATGIIARTSSPEVFPVTIPQGSVLHTLDGILLTAWLSLSAGLALWALIGAGRLHYRRHSWEPGMLLGEPVLWSQDMGPAIVGLFRPRVVLPSWVSEVEPQGQRLILAHEEEHRRARDGILRFAMASLLVAFPWNPFLWLHYRRLCVAIELDCDRRVIRSYPHRRWLYGDLLVRFGVRGSMGFGLGLTTFAVRRSFLEKRVGKLLSHAPEAGKAKVAFMAFAALLTVGVALRLPGIASGLQCDPHPADVATRDFAEAFAPLQPLVFRTTDPNPVLSVRALSVSPSGHLLVTDSRSGDLKLADGNGRIIRAIGRVGEGPGEFEALLDAAFLSDDRIVALDAGRVLATLFDSSGDVLNTFRLQEQFDPRAVVPLDDSAFLIGGLVGGLEGGNHLARIYSIDGFVSESFLPADPLLFDTGMIVDRVWGVALPGGSVALGLAITPAVHLFSESGAHICTQASEPPQWAQLLPRDEPAAMDAATREWIEQATLSGHAAYAGGSLYRQYGSSGEDGVSLLAEYDDHLNLRNIYTSPPGRLVGADAATLFFLGEETFDETRLLRFQPGRRR